MYAFWKGMNEFRLSEAGKVFRQREAVSDDYYSFITPEKESMLGYVVDNKIVVLLNASENSETFEGIEFPDGNWQLIANRNEVNHEKGVDGDKKLKRINGGKSTEITMEPTSLFIWMKK